MDSGFTKVNLSDLPSPEVVEELSYEAVLIDMVNDLQARDSEFSALVESDPAYKVLEVAAFRETLLRQRVNDAAKAVMLAYATGNDLDNLAANVPLSRKVVDPGDPVAYPPVPPTYESDDDFRRRVMLAPEGFSVAGPSGAYVVHALAVEGVKDAAVISPAPVDVEVYILGLEGDGTPSSEVMQAVSTRLTDSNVRPFTDRVSVFPAEVIPYSVEATIHMPSGPSPASVEQAARTALIKYISERHVMSAGVALSGIYEALHVAGVVRVELASPSQDILLTKKQAAFCESVQLSMVVE